jgi:hypothetical protein
MKHARLLSKPVPMAFISMAFIYIEVIFGRFLQDLAPCPYPERDRLLSPRGVQIER